MMIPKTTRLNANLIALFKFANKNMILDDTYPTMNALLLNNNSKICMITQLLKCTMH